MFSSTYKKRVNVYSFLIYAKGLECDHSLFIIHVHTNKYFSQSQYLPTHRSKEIKPHFCGLFGWSHLYLIALSYLLVTFILQLHHFYELILSVTMHLKKLHDENIRQTNSGVNLPWLLMRIVFSYSQ